MTRRDPVPRSYPAANEEAPELSACVDKALPESSDAKNNGNSESQISDQCPEPILATLVATQLGFQVLLAMLKFDWIRNISNA